MNRLVLALCFLAASSAQATKKPVEPCKIKSRQMTLVKNCFTGEMAQSGSSGGQFFTSLQPKTTKANYCYNSLVSVAQKPGDVQVHVRVLRDDKKGMFHVYHYTLNRDEVKKNPLPSPAFALQGLKGECFSSDPDGCAGGILKTIGWVDTDIPMVIALNKTTNGQYSLSQVVPDPSEIERLGPRELKGEVESDATRSTQNLIWEVRQRIMAVARQKTVAMRSGTTAKKLAESSEQFRYCSMALEGYLRDKKMSDPFSSDEKMTLAAITNFMNGDAEGKPGRSPASKR
jgi:hypothetical protein